MCMLKRAVYLMNNHAEQHTATRIALGIVQCSIPALLGTGCSAVQPSPISQTQLPEPTSGPVNVATQERVESTPTTRLPTPTHSYSPTPQPLPTLAGTPAGDGVITEQVGMPIEARTHLFIPSRHAWVTEQDHQRIIVYAGRAAGEGNQGVVIVVRSGTIWDPIGAWIESPAQSGGLTIVGAVGDRLILSSEEGDRLYFDVPGGQFATSLQEVVPTMTPGPTPSPSSTVIGGS